MRKLEILDLGRTNYKNCWDFQEDLFEKNIRAKKTHSETTDYLLLTEHTPVYTMGKSGSEDNIKVRSNMLGAEYYRINRGGDITFHGPGQLVAYPILDLEMMGIGLATYIFNLEEIIILLLKKYSIEGFRSHGASGVWLEVGNPLNERKICAIGVKASRYITMHGLACNIHTDLSYFEQIIPCGIADKKVTSLKAEGCMTEMPVIKSEFVDLFTNVFRYADTPIKSRQL